MAQLTDSQLVILNGAAQHEGGAVLPLPKSLRINKAAATTVLKSLLTRGLIEEYSASKDDETWREEGGQRFSLRLSDAGTKAIGAEEDQQPEAEPISRAAAAKKSGKVQKAPKSTAKTAQKGTDPHAGSKIARLIDLLRRKEGATLPEMVKATGWQAHSVRGAMSGSLKKKMHLGITSTKDEKRGRIYRIER